METNDGKSGAQPGKRLPKYGLNLDLGNDLLLMRKTDYFLKTRIVKADISSLYSAKKMSRSTLCEHFDATFAPILWSREPVLMTFYSELASS